jgi:hypothetical protein
MEGVEDNATKDAKAAAQSAAGITAAAATAAQGRSVEYVDVDNNNNNFFFGDGRDEEEWDYDGYMRDDTCDKCKKADGVWECAVCHEMPLCDACLTACRDRGWAGLGCMCVAPKHKFVEIANNKQTM